MTHPRRPSPPVLGTLATVAAAVAAASAAHAAPVACGKDEETIFRCRTTNDRMVAVCASRGFSAQKGALQYRYGTADHAELVLPAREMAPRDSAVLGNVMLSGGGGSALRFASGDHRYLVYSAVSNSWGAKAGVGVYRGDRQIAHVRCRDAAKADLDAPRLEKAGLAPSGDPFGLPD